MADWDDSTKFRAETTRTILLGIVGAITAIWLLKPWEKSIEYQAEVTKTKLVISARVVDEFLAASYRYTAVAVDACRGDKEEMKVFQGEAIDAFRSAENRLSVYFGGDKQFSRELDAVRQGTGQLGSLCISGASWERWEPVRQGLKKANNDLAVSALRSLSLVSN